MDDENRTESAHKELVRDFVETVFNQKNVDAAEEFLTEDYREYDTGTKGWFEGRREVVAANSDLFTAFPDIEVTEDGCICGNDTVVYRHTVRGTHEGEFLGVEPTGNEIELENVAVFRIEDGKIVEGWVYTDSLNMMKQLGIVSENPAGI